MIQHSRISCRRAGESVLLSYLYHEVNRRCVQIYGHLSSGWDVLCYIDIAVLAIALALILLFTGETPILRFPPRS